MAESASCYAKGKSCPGWITTIATSVRCSGSRRARRDNGQDAVALASSETNKRWGEWMAPIMKVDLDPSTKFPYLLPLQWYMD